SGLPAALPRLPPHQQQDEGDRDEHKVDTQATFKEPHGGPHGRVQDSDRPGGGPGPWKNTYAVTTNPTALARLVRRRVASCANRPSTRAHDGSLAPLSSHGDTTTSSSRATAAAQVSRNSQRASQGAMSPPCDALAAGSRPQVRTVTG